MGAALSSKGGAETGKDGTGLTAGGAENNEDEPGPGDRPSEAYQEHGISRKIRAILYTGPCGEEERRKNVREDD